MKKSEIPMSARGSFASIFLLICGLCIFILRFVSADLIMMNGNGMPSIVENDDIDPDVILMPGMGGMIMNDDLVL